MSVKEREEQLVELRCPIGPRALLAKVVRMGDHHAQVWKESSLSLPEFPLLELACRDCAKSCRREDPSVRRVLHRFNVFGQLAESVIEREGD